MIEFALILCVGEILLNVLNFTINLPGPERANHYRGGGKEEGGPQKKLKHNELNFPKEKSSKLCASIRDLNLLALTFETFFSETLKIKPRD